MQRITQQALDLDDKPDFDVLTFSNIENVDGDRRRKVTVTAALIRHPEDGRILICKRRKGDIREEEWEFPGGTLEKDETLEHCIAREIREELNLQVEVRSLLGKVEHTYPDTLIELYLFECKPVPHSGGEIWSVGSFDTVNWVSFKELSSYNLSGADKSLLSIIKSRSDFHTEDFS
jgi:mutator protein MutT